jgi:hypothetical protein
MLSPAEITFLCGFGGSVAVEVVLLYQFMQDDEFSLPERYYRPIFWIVRTLLAIMAGGLALAYQIDKPLLAGNTGAATPLIIKAFSEGIRPVGGNAARKTRTPKSLKSKSEVIDGVIPPSEQAES